MNKKYILIPGAITIILIIIIGTAYNSYQEKEEEVKKEELMRETKKIEMAVNEKDYGKVSTLLVKEDLSEIQQYSSYNFEHIKSELDSAIDYHEQFKAGNYEEFITRFHLNPFLITEPHLKSNVLSDYTQSVMELFKVMNNKEKLALADKIDYSLFPKDDAEKLETEITLAICTDLYHKGEYEEITIQTAKYAVEQRNNLLEHIYNLISARNSHEGGSVDSGVTVDLADIPEDTNFPPPFDAEYTRLMGIYRNTEAYKLSKKVNEEYDPNAPTRPSIGMTENDVIEIWGNPTDINRTETAYGISEQWVYYGHRYVYLENGFVTAIQD